MNYLRQTLSLLLLLSTSSSAYAQYSGLNSDSDMSPISVKQLNLAKEKKNEASAAPLNFNSFFKSKDLDTASFPPMNVSNMQIPGLSAKGSEKLGFNYFVVVNDTGFKNMTTLYKENRVLGKPSVVTVDSMMHPYFAYRNGLIADIIENKLSNELKVMMEAALKQSILDYKSVDDEEVQDDIQRNMAFLLVALSYFDPKYLSIDLGGASDLAREEIKRISLGKNARTAIGNNILDFGLCQPYGWMLKSPKLEQFCKAYLWLSCMYFPLSNVSEGTAEGGGNSFRRSVLLYRALALGKVTTPSGPVSALEVWSRICKVMSLKDINGPEAKNTILPVDLSAVFESSEIDLNKLLKDISKPLSQTKMLLMVKNKYASSLRAESFKDIGSGKSQKNVHVLRFFPRIDPPEFTWLKAAGLFFKEGAKTEEGDDKLVPLGLFVLHAHGSQAATNYLSEHQDSLDPELLKGVPTLYDLCESNESGIWRIIAPLFEAQDPAAQGAMRTSAWLLRQNETALAAWLDSHLACADLSAPQEPGTNKVPSVPPAPPAPSSAANSPRKIVAPSFHYLEPRPTVYKRMAEDCAILANELNKAGYFTESYKKRSEDFIKLFGRLATVATQELKAQPVTRNDFSILANIDQLLSQIDYPLSGCVYLGTQNEKENKGRGVTLGLGDAGRLFTISSTTQGATLCRGGVYTYYEQFGGVVKPTHWSRKLEFKLLRPPVWATQFDIVQDMKQ
ncbi:MAG: DUF3160 domain-containing protein [Candidatus Melainabacteria bacterium]|nr:DUF3160 domain-containing protein [Candidatus Melainabacteria bacterium]